MEQVILKLSAAQGPLYAPTPFWAAAAERLAEDLAPDRLARFRSLPGPLAFFVPTYGYPANGLTVAQIQTIKTMAETATPKQAARLSSWVDGLAHAEADYRVFSAVADAWAPHLLDFSESDVCHPVEHFTFDAKRYSRSALNYLLGLCLLAKHTDLKAISRVLEIGGGFGTLGEILVGTALGNPVKYIDVDIPPTCLFADHYLRQAVTEVEVFGIDEALSRSGRLSTDDLPALSILPNWQIERLEGPLDLFVNFISFQEMEPAVVENYLNHVERLAPRWILLRNMREGKQLRSDTNPVGVEKPILSAFYEEKLTTYRCVASDARTFGYITSDGFHSELLVFERRD